MILCIGTTPAAQRVMVFRRLELDGVNRAITTLDGAAGKSINVAKVLATLGARPIATGFVGGDRGRTLLRQLALKRIEAEFVVVDQPTRQCLSVLDESSHTVTELVEESRPVTPGDYSSLKVIIQKHLSSCDAVIMSGSLTPGAAVDFYKEITQRGTEAGILSVVDAQGPPLVEALAARPDLVKPNRQELARTFQMSLGSEAEVIMAMRQVHERGASRVVVTAGTSATLALDATGLWKIQSPDIKAVSPIGSGDAFMAALVWRLVRKEDLGEACRWGSAAGAANALSIMPGELDREDVERLAGQVQVKRL